MSEYCYRKVRDWAKESGLKLPDSIIAMMGNILEDMKTKEGGMSPESMRNIYETLIDQYTTRQTQKYKAAKKLELAKYIEKKAIIDEAEASGKVDREKAFMHTFDGGSIKSVRGLNEGFLTIASHYKQKSMDILHNMLSEEHWAIIKKKGTLVWEIFQELDQVQKKLAPGVSGSKEATEIAKAIDTLNMSTFKDKKSFNPFMELAEDFFGHRVWQREKVSSVPKDEWVAFMLKNYADKSFPDLSMKEKLPVFQKVYDDIVSGNNDSFFRNTGGKLKQMAIGRKFVANDVKAEFETFQKFGYDDLATSLGVSIERSSREVAGLSKFTSNPEEFIKNVTRQTFAGDTNKIKQMTAWALDFHREMTTTGSPKNSVDKVISIAKQYQAIKLLNLATLSSQVDSVGVAGLLRSISGRTILGEVASFYDKYIPAMVSNKTRLAIAKSTGMYTSHMMGMMFENLGFGNTHVSAKMIKDMYKSGNKLDALYHGMGKIGLAFSKFNFLPKHVDSAKAVMSLNLSELLGKASSQEHVSLTPQTANNLIRYNIGPDEWNLIRMAGELHEDTNLLTPRSILKLSDESVIEYMIKKGLAKNGEVVPEDSLYRIKNKLSENLGVMYNHYADMGSTSPGDYEVNWVGMNSETKDWIRATKSLTMQFKMSAITAARTAQRIAYSGADASKSDYAALATYMGMGFFVAGLSIYAKDFVKGKLPRNPTDPEFAARAFAASGIGGVFTDLFMDAAIQENPMFGQLEFLKGLAGPVLGEALEVGSLGIKTAKEAVGLAMDEPGAKMPIDKWGKLLINQTPNLPFIKLGLDHFLLNGLREGLDYGTLMRQEQRLEKNPGLFEESQRYWLPPTDSVQ